MPARTSGVIGALAVFQCPDVKSTSYECTSSWAIPSCGKSNIAAFSIKVEHRETIIPDDSLDAEHELAMTQKVSLFGHMLFTVYNRIDTEDHYQVRRKADEQIQKPWTQKTQKSVHSFHGISVDQPGEEYRMSYRYQLEQFIQRVRGRKVDAWVSADSSLAQMRAVDMAYQRSGLGPRPANSRETKSA